MNLLIVDDQIAVVNSIKNQVNWKRFEIDNVFCAYSAMEAKIIINNLNVDIILTDIEMPEENGLELFAWVKENHPEIEGAFITSHSDFEYALKAIQMGGIDYILQPARLCDIERVLTKVVTIVQGKVRLNKIEKTEKIVNCHRNKILDGFIYRITNDSCFAVDEMYSTYSELLDIPQDELCIYPMMVNIVKWDKAEQAWDEELIQLVFSNVLEELFFECSVCLSSLKKEKYWIMLVCDNAAFDVEKFIERIERFSEFVNTNMNFKVATFHQFITKKNDFITTLKALERRADKNSNGEMGVFCGDTLETQVEDAIIFAKNYIEKNTEKYILRGEVAALVHLNEEYFSKLFRQRTGYTFKNYVINHKISAAKKLLSESQLSVGIIASKVGFDNFSHFSKTFKKATDLTPQEFRNINKVV